MSGKGVDTQDPLALVDALVDAADAGARVYIQASDAFRPVRRSIVWPPGHIDERGLAARVRAALQAHHGAVDLLCAETTWASMEPAYSEIAAVRLDGLQQAVAWDLACALRVLCDLDMDEAFLRAADYVVAVRGLPASEYATVRNARARAPGASKAVWLILMKERESCPC